MGNRQSKFNFVQTLSVLVSLMLALSLTQTVCLSGAQSTGEANAAQEEAIVRIKKLGGEITVDHMPRGISVTSVSLPFSNVGDADLASIGRLTQLQYLA